mmetsp:Transcript_24428/g.56517  ORF Transcript_24428/g.56517 Transcript_24428/m.56517 type:complete len:129 (-) Transcript_24428:60-446(-)
MNRMQSPMTSDGAYWFNEGLKWRARVNGGESQEATTTSEEDCTVQQVSETTDLCPCSPKIELVYTEFCPPAPPTCAPVAFDTPAHELFQYRSAPIIASCYDGMDCTPSHVVNRLERILKSDKRLIGQC